MHYTWRFTPSQEQPLGTTIIGGHQNIMNYFAKHTPTFYDYELRDLQLMYYVSVLFLFVSGLCSCWSDDANCMAVKRDNALRHFFLPRLTGKRGSCDVYGTLLH